MTIWLRNYGEGEGYKVTSSPSPTPEKNLDGTFPRTGLVLGQSWVFSRKQAWKKLRVFPNSSRHYARHFTCIISPTSPKSPAEVNINIPISQTEKWKLKKLFSHMLNVTQQ